MDTEFGLKTILSSLGTELVFSDDADFSGVGEEPLKISEVVHEAFVEVNEEGTEAAAAWIGQLTSIRAILSLTRTPSLARAVERAGNETAVARLLAMLCILYARAGAVRVAAEGTWPARGKGAGASLPF
jgi:hypothetical protein